MKVFAGFVTLGLLSIFHLVGAVRPLPSLVYLTPKIKRETPFVLHYHRGFHILGFTYKTDQTHKIRYYFKSFGNVPGVRCSDNVANAGMFVLTATCFYHNASVRHHEPVSKNRLIMIFYDQTRPADMRALSDGLPRLASESKITKLSTDSNDDYVRFNDAVQRLLGGSASEPKCYVAIIDPPRRERQAANLSADSAEDHEDNTGVVLVYKSPRRLKRDGFPRLRWIAKDMALKYYYRLAGEDLKAIVSIATEDGISRLSLTNPSGKGVIMFTADKDSHSIHGLALSSEDVTLSDGRFAIVFFDPSIETVDYAALTGAFSRIMQESDLLGTTESQKKNFARVYSAIKDAANLASNCHCRVDLVFFEKITTPIVHVDNEDEPDMEPSPASSATNKLAISFFINETEDE